MMSMMSSGPHYFRTSSSSKVVPLPLLFIGRLRNLILSPASKKTRFYSVVACFCFCLLTFFFFISSSLRGLSSHDLASLPVPFHGRRGYSILINTWKRNDLLKKSVAHYATCSGVEAIDIVWSEPDPPTNSLYDDLRQAVKSHSNGSSGFELRFNLNKEDSLNNRFKEIKGLKTDAIFSVDDDVIVPCASVEFAFSVWRSAPSTMVGFVPRMHWLDKTRSSTNQYTYGGWWSVWWTGTYSIVLSKAAFFHKQYLDLYTNHMHASIRDYVTNNRNCEDIAMSFLVANVTGTPPIWVKGKIHEKGSTGISSSKGHDQRRSQCLNTFAAIYGHMPLVPTTVKALDSRNCWFW